MVNKLHQLKLLKEKKAENICATVCCNVDSLDCMYDTCKACKQKGVVVTDEEISESEICFQKWQTVGEDRKIKGIVKTVKIMKKLQ